MTITIYTKNPCKPCDDVKRILKAEGHEYQAIPFDLNKNTKRFVAKYIRENKAGFPVIFIDGIYKGSGLLAVHKIDPNINLSKYF